MNYCSRMKLLRCRLLKHLKFNPQLNVGSRYVSQGEPQASEITKDKMSHYKNKSLCTPAMSNENIESIRSVLGFNIGLSYVSWAAIETDGNIVTHMDRITLPQDIIKMELNDVYTLTSKVIQSFPVADCYVMESQSKIMTGTGGRLQQTLHASRLQFVAMLVSQLYNSRQSSIGFQSVVFLKPRLPGRLFNLLIGKELVSSETVVQELMEGISSNKFVSVKSTPELLTSYRNANNVEKEIMGYALLVSLAFTELVIHKNVACWRKLFGSTKKTDEG